MTGYEPEEQASETEQKETEDFFEDGRAELRLGDCRELCR
jgi:hypothetical protein